MKNFKNYVVWSKIKFKCDLPYDIYIPKTLIVEKVLKRRTAKIEGTEYLAQWKYFHDYSEQRKFFSHLNRNLPNLAWVWSLSKGKGNARTKNVFFCSSVFWKTTDFQKIETKNITKGKTSADWNQNWRSQKKKMQRKHVGSKTKAGKKKRTNICHQTMG